MWYQNQYRRHLCDMHIEDWNETFLSEFSPEDYFENLKKAKVQTAMLYFQSHVGYCYYPTKSGQIHRAFIGREDNMKKLVDLCRAGGIRVVGYYSLIYNNWAAQKNPTWQMIDSKGRTNQDLGKRYGLCCPNQTEYRAFIAEQLKEMSEYFTVDGMFFDMPFWPFHCYCPACQKRWEEEVGGTLPKMEDMNDPIWQLHIEKRQKWMGDFTSFVSKEAKKLQPNVSVEMNLANMICKSNDSMHWCTNYVNDSCDYAGGDLYGGILKQSFACKLYYGLSKNQPFEYMTSRCNPDLSRHTITKSKDQLALATLMTCAHHGAMLMIDAIDPTGTMNGKFYDTLGAVFEQEEQYEPYLKGNLIADGAVYYNILRKGNLNGHDFGAHTGAVNSSITLIENHIPFRVISNDDPNEIQGNGFIILPYANTLSREIKDNLIQYVQNGGTLYFSGAEEEELLQTFFGMAKTGYTKETVTYVAPLPEYETLFEGFSQKYPLPFQCPLPIVEGADPKDILAYIELPYTRQDELRFVSIHSDPPGIMTDFPAALKKQFGKGTVIWSAAPLENESISDYKQILLHLIYGSLPQERRTVVSNAPRDVEIISFRADHEIMIGTVHLSEADDITCLPGFEMKIATAAKPKEILKLPDKKQIPFRYEDGYSIFQTDELHILNMYQIKE